MLQRHWHSHYDRDPVGEACIWPCQCQDSDQAWAPTGNEGQSPSVARPASVITRVWPSRSTAPPSRSTLTRKLAPACNNYAGRSEVGSHLTLSREGCRQPDGGKWRTRRPVVAARAEKPRPAAAIATATAGPWTRCPSRPEATAGLSRKDLGTRLHALHPVEPGPARERLGWREDGTDHARLPGLEAVAEGALRVPPRASLGPSIAAAAAD